MRLGHRRKAFKDTGSVRPTLIETPDLNTGFFATIAPPRPQSQVRASPAQ